MEYQRLIGSDLSVSRITLGCEQMGGTDWGDFDEKSLYQTALRSVDLGINTFDTADVYGLGNSERFLKRIFKKIKHDVIIISKFGVRWGKKSKNKRAQIKIDGSPEYLEKALEGSLRRLGMDSIPIYFYHKPDGNTPIQVTLEAMQKQKHLGKIQNIGVSNFPIDLLKEANKTRIINCVQVQCNILDYEKVKPILQYCKETNLNVFTYGALAQGLLSGKYSLSSTFNMNDRRHRLPLFIGNEFEKKLIIVQKLKAIAEELNIEVSQLAIKYLLNVPEISSVIVGAKTPSQTKLNTESSEIDIDNKYLNKINSIVKQLA